MCRQAYLRRLWYLKYVNHHPLIQDNWNLYVDEMVDLVEINLDGIIFGEQKIDIIAYANDVTLLFSTKLGLQRQVDICSNYGKQYEIKFNPDKSL
jgi:hypothetical protein